MTHNDHTYTVENSGTMLLVKDEKGNSYGILEDGSINFKHKKARLAKPATSDQASALAQLLMTDNIFGDSDDLSNLKSPIQEPFIQRKSPQPNKPVQPASGHKQAKPSVKSMIIDFTKQSARDQAHELLKAALTEYNANGNKPVGFTYSANLGQTQDIKQADMNTTNGGMSLIGGANQALVVELANKILSKDSTYKDLRGGNLCVLPVTTMQRIPVVINKKKNIKVAKPFSVDTKVVENDLENIKNFDGSVLIWGNMGMDGKTKTKVAIGGGVSKRIIRDINKQYMVDEHKKQGLTAKDVRARLSDQNNLMQDTLSNMLHPPQQQASNVSNSGSSSQQNTYAQLNKQMPTIQKPCSNNNNEVQQQIFTNNNNEIQQKFSNNEPGSKERKNYFKEENSQLCNLIGNGNNYKVSVAVGKGKCSYSFTVGKTGKLLKIVNDSNPDISYGIRENGALTVFDTKNNRGIDPTDDHKDKIEEILENSSLEIKCQALKALAVKKIGYGGNINIDDSITIAVGRTGEFLKIQDANKGSYGVLEHGNINFQYYDQTQTKRRSLKPDDRKNLSKLIKMIFDGLSNSKDIQSSSQPLNKF